MKNLYVALLILMAGTVTKGQTTFSLHQDSVFAAIEVPEFTAGAPDTVFNLKNTPITINWTRFVLNISPNCVIQVCDPNNCYLPSVASKNFNIPANGQGHMIVDLVDTLLSEQPASAIVRIKYVNVGMTSDTANVYYFLDITASTGTSYLSSAVQVGLYPNPVTESFTLDNAEKVQHVRVYNMNGQQVAEYGANPGQRYSLANQPAGTYFVAVADENGRVIRALEVVKK